jgi:hypothetical protein
MELDADADGSRPPQQGYGYPPSNSPQPQYNNNYGGQQYGQPTPPPQQYGYNQVRRGNAEAWS